MSKEAAQQLQTVLLPNAIFGNSAALYVNGEDYIPGQDTLLIAPGGKVALDTWYNAFSTPLWKTRCGIHQVDFHVAGQGEARIRLMLLTEEQTRFELVSVVTQLTEHAQPVVSYCLDDVKYPGLLYIEIQSTGQPVTFSSGCWKTPDLPRRQVKLGIAVTHFNRKQYVLPSMRRVQEAILNSPVYGTCIDFTVVDNSANITPEEADGVNVIPNKNTGGAGGFMRGFLHYKDAGDFTHVLFMDDDASCEMESIKKTYSILSYALEDNAAVAGALFMETKPDMLIEKGARFDGVCRPEFAGWWMNTPESVTRTETGMQQPNYGAWWFFAFPVEKVQHLAFPFFVRGDDILFSMMNDFSLITTNGIACYAEDFATKVSATTWYLDTRNHLLNMLLFKQSKRRLVKIYCHFYLTALLSHRYGSADAIHLALTHVLGDKQFWKNNVDMSAVRPLLAEAGKAEKPENVDIRNLSLVFRHNHETRFRKLIRLCTGNGVLLPLKEATVYQEKGFAASLRQIFRFRHVFYYDKVSGMGYVATVSRKRTWQGLMRLVVDCIKLATVKPSQSEEVNRIVEELTTETFWRQVLLTPSHDEEDKIID